MPGSTSVTEVILHCQKQLKRDSPEDRILHYLRRLKRLHIKVQDLVDTGIGRTVNQLARQEGEIGSAAEELVNEWKALVEAEKSAEESSTSSEQSSLESDEGEGEDNENGKDQSHKSYHQLNGTKVEDDDEDEPDQLIINEEYKVYEQPVVRNESEDENDGSEKYHQKQIKSEPRLSDSESDYHVSEEGPTSPTQVIIERTPLQLGCGIKSEPKSPEDEEDEEEYIPTQQHHKSNRNSGSGKHQSDHDKHLRDYVKNITDVHGKHKKSSDNNNDKKHLNKNYHDKSLHDSKKKTPSPEKKKIKEEKRDDPQIHNRYSESELKKKKDHEDKSKIKKLVTVKSEIDSTSGLNFADVLGCLDSVKKPIIKTVQNGSPNKALPSSSKTTPSKKGDKAKKGAEPVEKYHDPTGRDKERVSHYKEPSKSSSTKEKSSLSKIKSESDPKPSSSKRKIEPSQILTTNYKPSVASRVLTSSSSRKNGLSNEILGGLDDGDDVEVSTTNSAHSTNHYYPSASSSSSNGVDALSHMISSRNQRTKVYSGVKSGYQGAIPSLYDMCIRIIQENIDELGYTGGVPYEIIKPVLERATVGQLQTLEEYNPYLIDSTGELWQFHCKRDFRGKSREELETWRELYLRCVEEREKKFQFAKKKVESKERKIERKAKLAYVEPAATGTKFNKSKAATIKNGMKSLKIREEKLLKRSHDEISSSSDASRKPTSASTTIKVEEASVIITPGSRAASAPATRSYDSTSSGQVCKKPKRAPLMQKTLKVIKSLSRR